MLKRLLLLSCVVLLAYRGQAQSASQLKITLPGELPGLNRPVGMAGRTTTISQLKELLAQNWDGTAWADFSRQLYTRYAGPALPGIIRTERKNGGSWAPYYTHRYRYTPAGKMLSDSVDQCQPLPCSPYFTTLYTYNAAGQLHWDWEKVMNPHDPTEPWDSLRRTSYAYNGAGQKTQALLELYDERRVFSSRSRQLWTYDALGQVTVFEIQSNHSVTGWGPVQRFSYTYTAAGKIQQMISETALLNNMGYGNTSRSTMAYDAQGREALFTNEIWDDNAWTRSSQTAYAYAPNGDLATATQQVWNPNTNAYQNNQRLLFSYIQVTAAHSGQPAASSHLTVAPNPGTGAETIVHYQLATPAVASVEVFDLTGRRVAVAQPTATQAAGEHQVSLSGSSLSPGLYMVRLRAGAQQWQVKWDKR